MPRCGRPSSRCRCRPDHALIDGRPVRGFPVPHTAIVNGDGISLSIAAASVIAKVTRDRLMDDLDARYPAYGFARHKGYATGHHLAILARDGPCPIHRFSFRPVAQPLLAFAQPAWPVRPIRGMSSARRGERSRPRWLRRRGYKVLYRNFRPARGGGEIDLVCRHAQTRWCSSR